MVGRLSRYTAAGRARGAVQSCISVNRTIEGISPILFLHFADRLRLSSSHFDQETLRSASGRMMAILAKKKKGIERAQAARAVEETLDLAASLNLAKTRRDMARRRIDIGQRAGEELCRRFDSFVGEVAKLPPGSKYLLNQSIQRPLAGGFFDTSIFLSV